MDTSDNSTSHYAGNFGRIIGYREINRMIDRGICKEFVEELIGKLIEELIGRLIEEFIEGFIRREIDRRCAPKVPGRINWDISVN